MIRGLTDVTAEPSRERESIGKSLSELTVNTVSVPIPAKLTATQLKGRQKDAESAENAQDTVMVSRPKILPRRFEPAGKPMTAAQKGTAMHQFMQYCDYEQCLTREGVELECQRLLRDRFLSPQQIEALDTEKLITFFSSEYGTLVTGVDEVRREFKFSVSVEADRYFANGAGETVMLQGVVDCFVITEKGIVVLDYKTDRVSPGGEQERAAYYAPQLRAYSYALSRIFGIPVIRRTVYFFATGQAVEA